jgi:dual specificity phosphatase 12
MTEIELGLFIGNLASSCNRVLLGTHHINAILSLNSRPHAVWGSTTTDYVPKERQKLVRCVDSSTQDLLLHLDKACDFIDAISIPVQSIKLPSHVRDEVAELDTDVNLSAVKGVVLVHGAFGISRSVSVLIAFLMRKYKMRLEDTLAMVEQSERSNRVKTS